LDILVVLENNKGAIHRMSLEAIVAAQKLAAEQYKLIDCQVYNSHLASLGAKEIPRKEFIKILSNASQA